MTRRRHYSPRYLGNWRTRLRFWLRCPSCEGRFGRHDLSDFLPTVPDRAVSVTLGRQRWDRDGLTLLAGRGGGKVSEQRRRIDRGTSG